MHGAMNEENEGRLIAGRYRLAEPIGRGAMGVVWRGFDELLDRQVAVKEVRTPSLAAAAENETVYQRTLREAKAAARLSHPGVVTVFDVVEEDGSPWIIMELLQAHSLDRLIAEDGPLAPLQAARMGEDLVGALACAHAAGVVHRDVKPGNVLLGPDGAVLTDFGIATVADDPAITRAGMVVGTPGFTAPERARGAAATPASDLWSLGATLYAAVEGRGPFDRPGGPAAINAGVVSEDAPRAPSAGPLGPVIDALLRSDPVQRPDAATAATLLADAAARAESGPGYPDAVGVASGPPEFGDVREFPDLPVPADLPDQAQLSGFPDLPASLALAATAEGPDFTNGPPGPDSPPGSDSAPWPVGSPGFHGPPGPDGASWPAGPPGFHGPPGPDSPPGSDSVPWAAGPPWPPSALWPSGPPCSPGQPWPSGPPCSPGQPWPAPFGIGGGAAAAAATSASQAPTGPFRSQPRRRRAPVTALTAITVVAAGLGGFFAYSRLAGAGAGPGTASAVQAGPPSASTQGSGGGHAAAPGTVGAGAGYGGAAAPGGGTGSTGSTSGASPPPPAGYQRFQVTAASSGTVAGFEIAAPATWTMTRQGLNSFLRPPADGAYIEISMAPFAYAWPLREAAYQQGQVIAQGRYPGYRLLAMRLGTFQGGPSAIWRFGWQDGAVRVGVLDLLFSARTTAGTQGYAASVSAPSAVFPRAEAIFLRMLATFRPLA